LPISLRLSPKNIALSNGVVVDAIEAIADNKNIKEIKLIFSLFVKFRFYA
jgi:hypothetical protein